MFIRKLTLSCISALLLQLPAANAQLGSDPDLFFKPAPSTPDLPADRYYPQGKKFIFTFYSVGAWVNPETNAHEAMAENEVQQAFKDYKAAGFDLFGPQYEMNARMLEDAKQHNLSAVYTIKYPVNFHGKEPVNINPDEVREFITKEVKAVMDNPNIAIWYITPEELRYWRKNEMLYLETASKAIREADVHKRPILIYDPAHANAKRLVHIAPWVDYLAKGMYTNYASMRDSRIWVRWSMEQEIEAIREANPQGTPLAVPEMFASRKTELNDELIQKIPDWVRHDAYLSLISGAKGIVVFSMRKRPSLPEPAWQAYRDTYFELAEELLGKPNLSQVFLFGEPRNEIQIDVVDGPQEVELLFPSGGVKDPITYPSVNYSDLAYGKDRYLFLVNSSDQAVRIMAGGFPYAAAKAETLFDDRAPFDIAEGEFEITLQPLEVKAYRFTRR